MGIICAVCPYQINGFVSLDTSQVSGCRFLPADHCVHALRNQRASGKTPLNSMTNTVMLLYTVLFLKSAQAIRASLLASPHSGNRSMLAMVQLRDPLFALVTLVFYATEDSSGTMNQQRAQTGIAALANPQQSSLSFLCFGTSPSQAGKCLAEMKFSVSPTLRIKGFKSSPKIGGWRGTKVAVGCLNFKLALGCLKSWILSQIIQSQALTLKWIKPL